jgi:hypothetical protein
MTDINKLVQEDAPNMSIVTGPGHRNWAMQNRTMNQFSNIGGATHLDKPIPNTPIQQSTGMSREIYPKLDLEPFQKKMKSCILAKRDIFVNVSPSGGKTAPVVRAWEEMLRNATNPSQIPKIIWICPNREVGRQIITEFRTELLDSIRDESLPPFLFKSTPLYTSGGSPWANANYSRFTRQDEGILKNEVDKWIGIEMDVIGKRAPTSKTIVSICTWNTFEKSMKLLKPRIIVIDEVQQRFEVENNVQAKEQAKALIETIKVAPPSMVSSIVLLTGSINSNIVDPFINYVNKKYNRNFEPIIEAVQNRASLKVFPCNSMTKYQDIIKSVKEQITGKSTNILIVKFSTKIIEKYCDELIKQLPPKDVNFVAGNKKISGISYQQKLYGQSYKYHQTLPQLAKTIQGKENSPEWIASNLTQMLTGHDGKGNRRDKKLAECLIRGFGYIKAPKEADGSRPPIVMDDMKIVEYLFKNGRISTLFATTMAGVGVNLKVRNLYITTLSIFPGKNISDSDLVQLVHRAGRTDNVAANIFCPPDDILKVTDAIKATPQLTSFSNMEERLKDADADNSLIQNIFRAIVSPIKKI